jgi:hypothetical protein
LCPATTIDRLTTGDFMLFLALDPMLTQLVPGIKLVYGVGHNV